jgi:Fur family transcriptional regulator, iron response regulator
MPWPSPDLAEHLRSAGLRPTRPRLALARLLSDGGHRHVTAEKLHREAIAAAIRVSLATVYNTLHQFTSAGLLREVGIAPGRSYFDTNVDAHHHFFCESTGMLQDIAGQDIAVLGIPTPPAGTEISHVEIIVRLRARDQLQPEVPDTLETF